MTTSGVTSGVRDFDEAAPFLLKAVHKASGGEAPLRLLLLHLTPYLHFPDSFSEPLGIEQLAGTLVKHGLAVDISLALLRDARGLALALREVESERYDLVGLGMPLGSYETANAVMERVRETNRRRRLVGLNPIRMLLGGNLPTQLPTEDLIELVEAFPEAVVVRGWGDEPLLQLMDWYTSAGGASLAAVPGLIYADEEGVKVNAMAARHERGRAGRPIRALLDTGMTPGIVGSEDCSHATCTFCARKPYDGQERWLPRAAAEIVAQMEDIAGCGGTQATFVDEEALGTDLAQAIAHGDVIAATVLEAKRGGKLPAEFAFAFSTRSDLLVTLADTGHSDVLQRLREAGLARVYLGVETGIPREFDRWDDLDIPPQGRRYGREISAADHVRALRVLRELGVGSEVGFIAFDPLMDLAEIAENARFLMDNQLTRHASVTLQKLRLHAGAPYLRLMDNTLNRLVTSGRLPFKPALIKGVDRSTLQADYRFLHPLVEAIVDLVSRLERETRDAVQGLRNYRQSRWAAGDASENGVLFTLARLRELDLTLLLELVAWARNRLRQRGAPLARYDELTADFNQSPELAEMVAAHRRNRAAAWEHFLGHDAPARLRELAVAAAQSDTVGGQGRRTGTVPGSTSREKRGWLS